MTSTIDTLAATVTETTTETTATQPARFVFVLGPPGAGKSTQCEWYASTHPETLHISSSEIAKSIRAKGKMTDEEFNNQYYGYLQELSTNEGMTILLDGFPRSMREVEECERRGIINYDVIRFYADESMLLQRILKRGRRDDTRKIFWRRIEKFNSVTIPVYTHFENMFSIFDNPDKSKERVRQDFEKKMIKITNKTSSLTLSSSSPKTIQTVEPTYVLRDEDYPPLPSLPVEEKPCLLFEMLPNEVIWCIMDYIPDGELRPLAATCRFLAHFVMHDIRFRMIKDTKMAIRSYLPISPTLIQEVRGVVCAHRCKACTNYFCRQHRRYEDHCCNATPPPYQVPTTTKICGECKKRLTCNQKIDGLYQYLRSNYSNKQRKGDKVIELTERYFATSSTCYLGPTIEK